MKYLIGNINDQIDIDVPISFIKNEYSKLEYYLIQKGLREYYKINNFKILYQENGKPYLDNSVNISISTCCDLVIVAFDKRKIGIDMENIRDIDKGIRKLLNISCDIDRIDALKEYCAREAVIKLEGKAFKDFLTINVDKYDIKYEIKDNYLIVIATTK